MLIHKIETLGSGFDEARSRILSSHEVGVDSETTGLNYLDDRVALLQLAVSSTECFVFFVDDLPAKAIADLLQDVLTNKAIKKIFHNAKFDVKFLLGLSKAKTFNVFDTMIASQLIKLASATGPEKDSLVECLKFYCGIEIDKTLQMSDFSGEISAAQVEYAAKDAMLLFDLKEAQQKRLQDLGLERVATVEFDAIPAIAKMERNGFYLNPTAWEERIKHDKKRRDETAAVLHEHFISYSTANLFEESSVDLDSPKQVLEILNKMGIPIHSTNEHVIKGFKKQYPILEDLFLYRGYSKALSSFGLKYLDHRWSDGRVHPDFWQLGAATGRMSCSKPNLQQVPHEKEYRECFQAESYNRLVVADYSQIEILILAEFSRDPALVKALNSNLDLHSFTASHVLKKPFEDCGKGTDARGLGKNLNFGTSYGVGYKTFAVMAEISQEQAKKALDGFWSLYKVLKQFQDSQGMKAQQEMIVRTPLGRAWDLRNVDGSVDNIGRNFPIQGTGADILKRAIYLIYAEPSLDDANLANLVHDETVHEVPEHNAEELSHGITQKMVEAGSEVISAVQCKVDTQVSKVWQK